MSEILKKPYEISVWEDRLIEVSETESYYDEVKLAVIGSDTMTSKNRVYSPVFKINTNGEKTLTFSLKYKYYDEIVGDFVVNPFEHFLVNERKIKLFFNNEWHDFVIKEKEEESEEYTFSYTCTDLFVQELARNGYGITFNTELNNNQGTITELAAKTLEGTDWRVDRVNSDLLQQTIVEPIYECTVSNAQGKQNFEALNMETNTVETIEKGETIYIFYSHIENKRTVDVQFLRAADQENWSYDNNNAIIGTNYRITGEVTYTESSGSMVINYGSAAINVGDISTTSQGYRLVYNNLTTYDPVTGKTVDIYEATYDDGHKQKIYHYTETEYGTSSVLVNYLTNGSSFSTYNGSGITGWSNAVATKSNKLLDLGIATYPDITTGKALVDIAQLKTISTYLEFNTPKNEGSDKYQYSYYNSGIADNAALINGINAGDKYLFRIRYRVTNTKHQDKLFIKHYKSDVYAVVAGYDLVQKTLEDGSKVTVKQINPKKIYLDFETQDDARCGIANIVISGGEIINNNYILNGVALTPSKKYIYKDKKEENKEYIWKSGLNQFVERTWAQEVDDNPGDEDYSVKSDIETDSNTRFQDYFYITATAQQSVPHSKLVDPSNRIGLFIYRIPGSTKHTNQYIYVEDIELTRYFEDANGNPIFVGSAPEAKQTTVDKFYLKPEENTKADNIELYSSINSLADNLSISSDIIKPLKNEACEKVLSIEASKSNCFNILQDLCETFECWLKIDVDHDETGKIWLNYEHRPNKKVSFKQYVGKENFAGFRYGINLTSINRSIDSDEFVTKLIVGQPSSEYAKNGVLNIGEADSNPSGESYILNFNYYINQGLIQNKEAFNRDINQFNKDLKKKNARLEFLNNEYVSASAALEHARANRNIYAETVEVASEKYAEALNNFQTLTGKTYDEFIKENPNFEDVDKSDALLKQVDTVYANAVQVNNYSGLLTNINEEYKNLDLKCNGVPTYSGVITTFREDGQEQVGTTRLVLSDYFEGFECIFDTGTEITSEWSSGVNDKDFNENIVYKTIIIKKIPQNYELQYTVNGNTHTSSVLSPIVLPIYDITNDIGITRNFSLIPTEEYKADKIGLKGEIERTLEEKKEIEKEFYAKYSRFIQEGTWESNDYIDNELYYLDALQVSNASAQPKVSYTINVIEVSEIEGLENYNFNVGDKTYIEDTDFFGWETYSENGVTTNTPVKEIVIVSEVEWHLDEPETNIITVQNYKTQFEDLFQRISATVQSVQYNQANYARAANILDANGHINPTLLVGSLNAIAGQSYDLASGGVLKTTEEGLIVRNLTEPGNLLIIKGRGIERSTDGGRTWKNLISAEGVNTEELTSGSVNTRNITILDGENPSFRWDAAGISAFGQNQDGTYDLNTYVRYDKYGLYGVQNGQDYAATSLDDVKENASFGLTWDGFFIKNKYRDGYVSISSTDDFQVVANNQERIKIGHFNSNDYGIRIKNDEGETVFRTDKDGNIEMAGTIRAAGGDIAGFIIESRALRYGTPGQDSSILISPGYSADLNIAGARSEFPWAFTAGNDFGVDTSGHLYARNATIEGDIYAHNGYFSGYVNAVGGNFSETIQIGNGEKYILIDASPGRSDSLIASSNYIENSTAGWAINGYGDAIFNNVSVRGAIKTAVFEYNEIEAVGGAFLFRPSTTIKHASSSGNDLILTLEKPNLFQENEWVKLSNVNTESDDVNSILNDGGLTHVYRIKEANGKQVVLDGAAVDFIPEINVQSYDSWGSVSVDAETGRNIYSTVMFSVPYSEDEESEFGHLTNYVDLTKTVGQNEEYISLNAPKYSIYFNGKSIIKTMNFDLVDNVQYHRVILQPSIEGSPIENRWYEYINHEYVLSQDQDIASGKTYYYRTTNEKKYNEVIVDDWGQNEESIGGRCIIHKYIGNLSLFWPSLTNTAESFLVAEIEFPDGETKTRIYSDLSGEREFVLKAAESKEYVEDLEGGSLISFGFDEVAFRPFNVTAGDNPTVLHLYELVNEEYVLTEDTLAVEGKTYYKEQYEGGAHNYGIGINSSDNYVNLPERAISLFESEIHEDESIKVTYNFRGILGTLPQTLNNTYYNIYKNMAGTQGIYTDNMYIGDEEQFLVFYTDEQGRRRLRIRAHQIEFESPGAEPGESVWHDVSEIESEGVPGPQGENAISIDIQSNKGDKLIYQNEQAVLTCYVKDGKTDITNQISTFIWHKKDKFGNEVIVEDEWPKITTYPINYINIDTSDIDVKAIFECEVNV